MIAANNLANWNALLTKLAMNHYLIRHQRLDADNTLRKSFFKCNNEQEFSEAIVNQIHFPCMVHTAYSALPSSTGTGYLRKRTENTVMILAYIPHSGTMSEGYAAAYQQAESICEDILNYLAEQHRERECNSDIFLLDIAQCSYTQLEEITQTIVGFELTLVSTGKFTNKYNPSVWL